MAWALATVGQRDEQLFKVLARMAERRLDEFNAQNLANTAWALAVATVGQQDEQLFKALARMAEQRLDEFTAQGLANTAWALTDSAACTLGSCRSVALGGGAGGDGSRVFLGQSDAHPKLGHFSLQDPFFSLFFSS